MRSAPMLNSWMIPFSSVAMIEKLALFRIAACRAPVLSRVSWRWISMPAALSRAADSSVTVDIGYSPFETELLRGAQPAWAVASILATARECEGLAQRPRSRIRRKVYASVRALSVRHRTDRNYSHAHHVIYPARESRVGGVGY